MLDHLVGGVSGDGVDLHAEDALFIRGLRLGEKGVDLGLIRSPNELPGSLIYFRKQAAALEGIVEILLPLFSQTDPKKWHVALLTKYPTVFAIFRQKV